MRPFRHMTVLVLQLSIAGAFTATMADEAERERLNPGYAEDFAAMERCLADPDASRGGKSCTEIIKSDCMERRNTSANVDLSFCFGRVADILAVLDGRAAIKRVSAALHMVEMHTKMGDRYGRDGYDLAVQAEKAWSDYRRAQCDSDMSAYGAGSVVSFSAPACTARLYEERLRAR